MKKYFPALKTFPAWPLPAALLLASAGQFFLLQRDIPWTLWAGLGFYGPAVYLALRAMGTRGKDPAPPNPPAPRLEAVLFFLILAVAAFFRLYRLEEFPPGLFNDVAKQGYGAMRVLREGWSPFQEPDLYLGGSLSSFFYWLALWFGFTGHSSHELFLASVAFSLLAFPFFYFCARQLAGPRAALLALFFLAVMRWHVTYSRDGHPAVEVPFYVFGALVCWLWTLESKNRWGFFLLALFLAGGCYSYEAFLAFFPALALLGLYEFRKQGDFFRRSRIPLLLSTAVFLALTARIWRLHWGRGSLGAVYDHLSFLSQAQRDGPGFWGHQLAACLLMFNREGDAWFFHNIPGHRMLDDVTGILMLLGVFLAAAHWRQRKYFYGLTGFTCALLPNLFSTLPAHASRSFGATGFCAILAAYTLDGILEKIPPARFPQLPRKFLVLSLLAPVLLVSAAQNFKAYFGEQAGALSSWRGYGWEATLVGDRIQDRGGKDDYYLSSPFFNHYAVLFLGYSQRSHIHELSLPGGLVLAAAPGRGALFALGEGRTGVLDLIQALYPGGKIETVRDPFGRVLVYFYEVPPELATKGRALVEKFLKSNFGLTGTYYRSLDLNVRPALVHRDPLINFTFRNDFPLDPAPPLSIGWTGSLEVPAGGVYRFAALTTDQVRMTLRGKTILAGGGGVEGEAILKKGGNSLEVFFQKTGGIDTALTLLWQKPGDTRFEVIPFSAYRKNR